jgi:hypothetical protein
LGVVGLRQEEGCPRITPSDSSLEEEPRAADIAETDQPLSAVD